MGKLYTALAISFTILVLANLIFFIINIIFWATNGLQALLDGMNFVERIYYSVYFKWILLGDALWLVFLLIFMVSRKHYKTDPEKHYLNYLKQFEPKICVVLPTFNEEKSVGDVIKNFMKQKQVKDIVVVDNNSNDKTIEIAKKFNVTVVTKDVNKGYADSCLIGLTEALKTDSNVIVLSDADGTFDGSDLSKIIPYLENCDMVIGSRQIQVLTEKGNQNSMFYVWGNLFIAKLMQIKYFSLLHMGVVQLTDVGCAFRAIRSDSLSKIIDELSNSKNKKAMKSKNWLFTLMMTMTCIENDLKIVEVPITFKKRIGESKSEANKKSKGILYGFAFIWYIISR